MRTFALAKKRPVAAVRRPTVAASAVGVLNPLQQARVRRILHGPTLQAKPIINKPGDRYEQEADRVASQVIRMPEPATKLEAPSPLQVQRLSVGDRDGALQAKQAPSETPTVTPQVESQIDSLANGGQPLAIPVRDYFTPRFGLDFSQVRIHDGARAAATAAAIDARAFTVGRNIVFGAGEYTPRTAAGMHLLAHELVHTIQQSPGEGPDRRQGPASVQMIQRKGSQIVISAGGYDGYSNDADELETLNSLTRPWYPNTKDFHQTSNDTPGSHRNAATKADEFFGALQALEGKIRRIVFIGHGSSSGYLGLSGHTLGPPTEVLDESDLNRWQVSIDTLIKPKLDENAKIDLYACQAGLSEDFMKAMAKSFGICVRGFERLVAWCISWNDEEITSRGRLAEEGSEGDSKNCLSAGWHKGVNGFLPPKESCP
jgi:hypothetical protein